MRRAHSRAQWDGNVRELRNVVEHAVLAARDDTLRVGDLPDEMLGETRNADDGALPGRPQGVLATLAETEVRQIGRALAQTGGAITAAAELLGIHRNTLTRKMKEYGL
jgi:transcriptional regulator of acetoin/glycerol metabolism